MNKKPTASTAPAPLRGRAELLRRKLAEEKKSEATVSRSPVDSQRLLHELQVHQIELELQNEELQKARDEINAGLEKYTDLYDFAPVSYLTLDSAGAILEANLTAAGMLDIPRGELIGLRLGVFVAPADRRIFHAFLEQVFERKEQSECEVTLLGKKKPAAVVRIRANLLASGLACRATGSDITLQKQAEADRLVLEKLESTGILAGGIAHDFNNLLTVILLNLEMAGMLRSPDDQLPRYLREARRACQLAHDLTQQLITFSEGGHPLRKPTDLPVVIEESTRLALTDSRWRGEFSLADDHRLVEADSAQIGQVVRNLVCNAREAMPEGGTVSVRMENVVLASAMNPSLPAGPYLRVSITDQGGGIAPEVLPKIFDPYFSTKQIGTQKGMGLGLTICRSIIQKHDGAIIVETVAGEGTTFHFYLPALESAPIEGESPEAKPSTGSLDRPTTSL